MAIYTDAELLNELSLIFRARLTPSRNGGNLNTREEYEQLLDMASLTFLFAPDGIFYVAQLAANKLRSIVTQEVALVEDMLVALDDLSQRGQPVTDTTTLSNAKTTVLALDAAQSLTGRPETDRFDRQMASYAAQFYGNTVSQRTQDFVHPKEEARTILKTDLKDLQAMHDRLLPAVTDLRDLLTSFNALDIASKASTAALAGVRKNLDDMMAFTETATGAQNLEASRRTLLKALANKSAVNIIGTFSDPSDVRYRSPVDPVPVGLSHLGRAVGDTTVLDEGGLSGPTGSAAQVTTAPGPWTLPVSAPLVLAFNGESSVSVPVDQVRGPCLVGRNQEPFSLDTLNNHLHVLLDPNFYDGTVNTVYSTSSCLFTPGASGMWLGFRHLGAPLLFRDTGGALSGSNLYPRVITDITQKGTGVMLSYTPSSGQLITTTSVFSPGMVGGYVKNASGDRREILSYVSGNTVMLDDYDAGMTFPGNTVTIFATYNGDPNVRLWWSPALGVSPTANTKVQVCPAQKTATLPSASSSVSSVIASINTIEDTNMPWWSLRRYVRPVSSPGDPTKLSLELRSRWRRHLQIVDSFLQPSLPSAGAPTTVALSGHGELGFVLGERLDPRYALNNFLSASVLAELITEYGLPYNGMASTQEQVLYEGTLRSMYDDNVVQDESGLLYSTLGVAAGDQVEILDGTASGRYRISYVNNDQLQLEMDGTFSASEQGLRYRVFRETVLIYSLLINSRSSVQVVSSPAEMGLVADTYRGTLCGFEAVNRKGELLSFTKVAEGDVLRILGWADLYTVLASNGTLLTLASGVPANLVDAGFEIVGTASSSYNALHDRLVTFTTSSSLLKKNQYDVSLDALAYALVAAMLPGQNFESSRNQTKRMMTDLLSILTATPLRAAEYSATVPTAADNLTSILTSYSVDSVKAIDDLLEAFLDRKYERAADLLTSAKIEAFFGTTDETGSYAGNLLATSRAVVRDLPRVSQTQEGVARSHNLAVSIQTGTNPETDFSDVEDPQLVEE
jgi:hypothetical protein